MNIKFFPNKSVFLSHKNGLNILQVQELKSLCVGDQLVLFVNEDGSLILKKSNLPSIVERSK